MLRATGHARMVKALAEENFFAQSPIIQDLDCSILQEHPEPSHHLVWNPFINHLVLSR